MSIFINMNSHKVILKELCNVASCPAFYSNLDPCEKISCADTNSVCEVIFSTGYPRCVCPAGMQGDPRVGIGCGMHAFCVL